MEIKNEIILNGIIGIIAIIIITIILTFGFIFFGGRFTKYYEEGYLDACKDYYNGFPKYNLIKNKDGTVEWRKLNEKH